VDIEAALLTAIHETPEDDTPRLALADWLMEQPEAVQQARGEFIHVQCRLARMAEYAPERPALEARERALREEHAEAWLDGLTAFVHPGAWTFQRGMLGLSLQGPQVWVSPEDVAWLADWQWVDRIALRDFDEVPALWLRSPALGGITSLHCFGPAASTVIDVLAQGGLPGLRELDLSSLGVGDLDLERLAASPAMSRLTGLRVFAPNATSIGALAVARSPRVTSLRGLELQHGIPSWGEGSCAIASSPYLAGLSALGLGCGGTLGREGIRALSRRRHLKKLSLRLCAIGPEEMKVLTGSGALSRLASLELHFQRLGDRGARLLASSPSLCRLQELSLVQCDITAAGAAALAQSANLHHLRLLDLAGNDLRDAGVKALAASPHLRQLQSLNLSETRCGDEGVAALACSPFLTNLTVLDLNNDPYDDGSPNGMTERGARLLTSSAPFQRLQRLSCFGNSMTPEGMAVLRAHFGDRLC
jgi:uncharacterized protein (TIGR02996 family)